MNLKKIKLFIACSVCGIVLMLGGVEAKATQSVSWSSSTIPGSYSTSSTTRTMTYYAGKIKFVATNLYTDGSYVVGKCEGVDISIKNANGYAVVSIVNAPTYFKITPVAEARTTMKFKGFIEHDATYLQTASGRGTISY